MSRSVDGPDDARARATVQFVTIGFFALVLVALAIFASLLHKDREALLNAVERERLEQVDSVVRLVSEDVDDVLDDLELVARVAEADLNDAVTRNVLQAVLSGVKAYRVAGLYSVDGPTPSFVVDPRQGDAELEALQLAMTDVADRLRAGARSLAVSPVVSVEEAYFRIFGYRSDAGAVVVLAVETTAWLTNLRLVSSDPQNRVLVLGPTGRVAPWSDEKMRAAAAGEAAAREPWASLLSRMRAGERGTTRVQAKQAPTLGLERADYVVAYAPIRLPTTEHWSLATFTSIAAFRAQEHALILRFVVIGTAIILLLLAFAGYIVVATRRYALLRERFRHAAQMADLNTQLIHAEKLATVGGLSAGIAHEIGTPLGVVRGRAEYALKKLEDEHPARKSLVTIVEQIDRVSRIVRELLDFAQPRPAEGRPTSLAEISSKTADLMEIEFDRAGMKLRVNIPESLPLLDADPDQLQQVLVNLLVNARDACAEGDEVVIAAEVEDDRTVIRISDTGPGIPEELVNHVFDPFFTTKKRGQGTGLGLSVVSQIVRSHGGEVELDSQPGAGTTVSLRWPLASGDKGA